MKTKRCRLLVSRGVTVKWAKEWARPIPPSRAPLVQTTPLWAHLSGCSTTVPCGPFNSCSSSPPLNYSAEDPTVLPYVCIVNTTQHNTTLIVSFTNTTAMKHAKTCKANWYA